MEKKYCWKVLSEDGLLKYHCPLGPYYSQDTLDDVYDTEYEAVSALANFRARHEYGVDWRLVLVTMYQRA
jgi:hypothetical protein